MLEMVENLIYTLEYTYPVTCVAPPVGPCVPSGVPVFEVTKQQLANIKNNIPLFKSDRVKLPTDNMYGK